MMLYIVPQQILNTNANTEYYSSTQYRFRTSGKVAVYIVDDFLLLTFPTSEFLAFCFLPVMSRQPCGFAARAAFYSLVADIVSVSSLDDDVEILAPPSKTVRPPSVTSIPPPATEMPLT